MVWSSPLSSLEDGLPFLEEGFAGFLGVLATKGDANIGQLVAELLFHVAGLERFHHAAFYKPQSDRRPMAKFFAITGQSICELRVVDDFSGHAERDRLLAQHRAVLHHKAHRLLITHGLRQRYGEPGVG